MMNTRFALLFILVLGSMLQTSIGFGGEICAGNDQVMSHLTRQFPLAAKALNLAQCIPLADGTRRGIQVWMKLNGFDASTNDMALKNSIDGISNWNRELLGADPCLSMRAKTFIERVNAKSRSIKNGEKIDFQIAGLTSGKGEFSQLQPGWLWQDALAAADGDPNLAFRIISVSTQQMEPVPVIEDAYERQEFATSVPQLLRERQDLVKRLQTLDPTSELYRKIHYNYLEKTWALYPGVKQYPSLKTYFLDSGLYLLENSLGPNTDLPDQLKNDIAYHQHNSKTQVPFRTKSYHVIKSAALACEVIRAGGNPKLAVALQDLTAWGYRTMRLSLQIRERKTAGQSQIEKDTVALMERWYLHEAGIYTNLPKPNPLNYSPMILSLVKAEDTPAVLKKLREFGRPEGWTQDRYENARSRLVTWLIDWKWTTTQHRLGAEFAAKHCRPVDPKDELLNSCSASASSAAQMSRIAR